MLRELLREEQEGRDAGSVTDQVTNQWAVGSVATALSTLSVWEDGPVAAVTEPYSVFPPRLPAYDQPPNAPQS